MELQMIGVENLKKLASGVALSAKAVDGALEDGQISFGDAKHVPDLFSGIRQLSSVDLDSVWPEVENIDDAEREDLANHFRSVFDLKSDDVELAIEEGLDLLLRALQAIMSFKDIAAKVK